MSKITICDILKEHGGRYITENKIKGQQKGIIKLLSACQTSALGSHFRQCHHCGYLDKVNNSCRNRHCPNCQQKDREKWLEKRMEELLPVGYYHLVFTLPHQLNRLCLKNKKVMYNILFKAASISVLELCKDTRHLGANAGLITVLHTWGQNMMEHPHLHCIMPAGGLSFDKNHWVNPAKSNGFFIHYKVLSSKFRGKFLAMLKEAYQKGELSFKSELKSLGNRKQFNALLSHLYAKPWVVNIQKPLGRNPERILEYLSRYVFRIAISDRRIQKVENQMVHFTIKDYKNKGIFRKLKLTVNEFIRRFLLHLLPKGFLKIRYYGLFANVHRKKNIARANEILGQQQATEMEQNIEDGIKTPVKADNTVWMQIINQIKEYLKLNCPACKKGRMKFAGLVPPGDIIPVLRE